MITAMGFPHHGYSVRRAAGDPICLPTKDELAKSIQFLHEDHFVPKIKQYYHMYHVGKEVRVSVQYESHFSCQFDVSCSMIISFASHLDRKRLGTTWYGMC